MEVGWALPHSQKPPPVPVLRQIRPVHGPAHSLKINFNIILPSKLGSFNWSFPLKYPHKNSPFISSSSLLHVPSISFFLIWSPKWHLVRSADHWIPRCIVFCSPLLPRPSSSAPYSRIPSAYVPTSPWQTKSHTHKKNYSHNYSYVVFSTVAPCMLLQLLL